METMDGVVRHADRMNLIKMSIAHNSGNVDEWRIAMPSNVSKLRLKDLYITLMALVGLIFNRLLAVFVPYIINLNVRKSVTSLLLVDLTTITANLLLGIMIGAVSKRLNLYAEKIRIFKVFIFALYSLWFLIIIETTAYFLIKSEVILTFPQAVVSIFNLYDFSRFSKDIDGVACVCLGFVATYTPPFSRK